MGIATGGGGANRFSQKGDNSAEPGVIFLSGAFLAPQRPFR